jgi:hypothetical protein
MLGKVRVEAWRLAWYKRAHGVAKAASGRLTWSRWVRDALDRHAAQVAPGDSLERSAASAPASAPTSDDEVEAP